MSGEISALTRSKKKKAKLCESNGCRNYIMESGVSIFRCESVSTPPVISCVHSKVLFRGKYTVTQNC